MNHPLSEELRAVEKRAYAAFASGVFIALFGVIICTELHQLVTGARESVRTFRWILALYDLFGLSGVAAGMGFFALVTCGAGVGALKERTLLIAKMGAEAYRQHTHAEHAATPAFLQATDKNGRIPKRTWLWLGLLLALLIAVYVGAQTGAIR